MNTLTYNSQSQLIVTSNPDNQILQSASYKAGMEDITNDISLHYVIPLQWRHNIGYVIPPQ